MGILFDTEKEFESLDFRNQRKNLRVLEQRGRTFRKIDSKRSALAPGKRISKSGKVYWETRKNRSDQVGGNI